MYERNQVDNPVEPQVQDKTQSPESQSSGDNKKLANENAPEL